MADMNDTKTPVRKDSQPDGRLEDAGSPPSPFLGLEDYVNFEGYPSFRNSAVMYENSIYRYRIHRILPMIVKAKTLMFKIDSFKKEISQILTKSFDFEKSEVSKLKKYGDEATYDFHQCMDHQCPIHPDTSVAPVAIGETIRNLATAKPRFLCSELNKTVNIDKYPAYKSSVKHYNEYVTAEPASRRDRWKSSYNWLSSEEREKHNLEHEIQDHVEDPMEKYAHLKGDISDIIDKYSFVFDPKYILTPLAAKEADTDKGKTQDMFGPKQASTTERSSNIGNLTTVEAVHLRMQGNIAGETEQRALICKSAVNSVNSHTAAATKSVLNFMRTQIVGINSKECHRTLNERPNMYTNGALGVDNKGNNYDPNLNQTLLQMREFNYHNPSRGIGLQGPSGISDNFHFQKAYSSRSDRCGTQFLPTVTNQDNSSMEHTQLSTPGHACGGTDISDDRRFCKNYGYQIDSTQPRHAMNCGCQTCAMYSQLVKSSTLQYFPQLQQQYIRDHQIPHVDVGMSPVSVQCLPNNDISSYDEYCKMPETPIVQNVDSLRIPLEQNLVSDESQKRKPTFAQSKSRSRSSSISLKMSIKNKCQSPRIRSRRSRDRVVDRRPYRSNERVATRHVDRMSRSYIERSRSRSRSRSQYSTRRKYSGRDRERSMGNRSDIRNGDNNGVIEGVIEATSSNDHHSQVSFQNGYRGKDNFRPRDNREIDTSYRRLRENRFSNRCYRDERCTRGRRGQGFGSRNVHHRTRDSDQGYR